MEEMDPARERIEDKDRITLHVEIRRRKKLAGTLSHATDGTHRAPERVQQHDTHGALVENRKTTVRCPTDAPNTEEQVAVDHGNRVDGELRGGGVSTNCGTLRVAPPHRDREAHRGVDSTVPVARGPPTVPGRPTGDGAVL